MKLVSTTALAKEKEMEATDLFAELKGNGWIYKKDDQWHLTKEGRIAGGDMIYNPKFGEYIVWPLNLNLKQKIDSTKTYSATVIGEQFNVSSQKINKYLFDLGWVEKDKGGWVLTPEGKKNGGHQLEAQNGKPYTIWDENIVTNKHLKRALTIGEGLFEEAEDAAEIKERPDDFRLKYPANQRTSDGHYVRSRAELLIDNFLYQNGIVHAYERKLNIDEPMYCDFYLPLKKVYIEFWGLEENEKYLERKKIKLQLYSKYNFNLIELNDSDIVNLDETLSAKLRKYNIIVD